MKKTLMGLALICSASSAFAGSAQETYNARNLSYQVNNLIQTRADGLSDDSLRQIENLLIQAQGIALGLTQIPAPLPPPAPAPRFQVSGTIQGAPYSFTVTNLNSLYDQCTSFVKSKSLANIDTIEVSVNFSAIRTITNSSAYWTNEDAVCSQIVGSAKGANIAADTSLGHTVTGTIQNKVFKFFGSDLVGLSNQCTSFVTSNGLNNVDTIYASVDFNGSRALVNQSAYWTNTFDICQQILQLVH